MTAKELLVDRNESTCMTFDMSKSYASHGFLFAIEAQGPIYESQVKVIFSGMNISCDSISITHPMHYFGLSIQWEAALCPRTDGTQFCGKFKTCDYIGPSSDSEGLEYSCLCSSVGICQSLNLQLVPYAYSDRNERCTMSLCEIDF